MRVVETIEAHPGRWILGALVALMLAMFIPGVDIGLSTAFYDPTAGFNWDHRGPLEFVRRVVPDIIIASVVVVIALWVVGLWREQWIWSITTPRMFYVLSTILIGPGLIVETLLKPNWGRARPKDITAFGGAGAYTPPLWISHECERNCSFVSGHAAVAFWVTAYAFLLPRKWRLAGLLGGLAFGFGVGLVRVMQGAHFLSDVVFAAAIVVGINFAFARAILDRVPRT